MQLAVETAVGKLWKCISHIAKPQDSKRLQTGAEGTAVRAKCQNVKPQHLEWSSELESESELELKSSWLVMDAKLVDRQAGSAAPPPLPRCVIGPGHLRVTTKGCEGARKCTCAPPFLCVVRIWRAAFCRLAETG